MIVITRVGTNANRGTESRKGAPVGTPFSYLRRGANPDRRRAQRPDATKTAVATGVATLHFYFLMPAISSSIAVVTDFGRSIG